MKREIKIKPTAQNVWDCFTEGKTEKYERALAVFTNHVRADFQLGVVSKATMVDNFLKSSHYKALEIDLETDGDFVCWGYIFAVGFRAISDEIAINQHQEQMRIKTKTGPKKVN